MPNFFLFLLFLAIIGSAILAGKTSTEPPQPDFQREIKREPLQIPHIGSIEVLNGCGIEGAANRMAEYLRSKQFDVKNIDNAKTWNYPFTMVISRTLDMKVANEVASALGTENVVLLRDNNDNSYDVTVVLGPDYKERIK
ncbi:LytR C-terminal domain-containing protein [Chitinispirillales bacterium ANBcel5]|uniref:LytR C-terminal domain-containing protein n=1 Tax=Cellulosispirillum alkaliphilum TaxID=3039283 RepID=UPI002A518803|nr:LytR C-terminal domain-containing protein [Chitinispirillales bacterium ANBcel5]